jgi:hypothetical protein
LAPRDLGLNGGDADAARMRRDDGLDQLKFFGQRGAWHQMRLLAVNLSRPVVRE